MSKIIARAIYQDKTDPATYEYRIEERPDGFALMHGIAGTDMQAEEHFGHEYEMRSMLPTPYPETPSCNLAVESLLDQWTAIFKITQYDVDQARRMIDCWVDKPRPQPSDDQVEPAPDRAYHARRQKTKAIQAYVFAHPENSSLAAVLAVGAIGHELPPYGEKA